MFSNTLTALKRTAKTARAMSVITSTIINSVRFHLRLFVGNIPFSNRPEINPGNVSRVDS